MRSALAAGQTARGGLGAGHAQPRDLELGTSTLAVKLLLRRYDLRDHPLAAALRRRDRRPGPAKTA
jgi:hypothetical protein